MANTKHAIGDKIRWIRNGKGLSQRELAERIGISFQYLSKWERGIKNPTATNIIRIADALGVATDDILTEGTTTKKGSAPSLNSIIDGISFSSRKICDVPYEKVNYEKVNPEEVDSIFEQRYKPLLPRGFLTAMGVKQYVGVIKRLIEEKKNLQNRVDALEQELKDLAYRLRGKS